jgi:hypothetical protein
MALIVTLLSVVLAAAPSPQWKAVHTSAYGLSVPPGQTRTAAFPIPPKIATPERVMTFSWTVIRPNPVPALVVLEQCNQPDVCHPLVMWPTSHGRGTTKTTFRLTNRSARPVDIQFSYTVWEPR